MVFGTCKLFSNCAGLGSQKIWERKRLGSLSLALDGGAWENIVQVVLRAACH